MGIYEKLQQQADASADVLSQQTFTTTRFSLVPGGVITLGPVTFGGDPGEGALDLRNAQVLWTELEEREQYRGGIEESTGARERQHVAELSFSLPGAKLGLIIDGEFVPLPLYTSIDPNVTAVMSTPHQVFAQRMGADHDVLTQLKDLLVGDHGWVAFEAPPGSRRQPNPDDDLLDLGEVLSDGTLKKMKRIFHIVPATRRNNGAMVSQLRDRNANGVAVERVDLSSNLFTHPQTKVVTGFKNFFEDFMASWEHSVIALTSITANKVANGEPVTLTPIERREVSGFRNALTGVQADRATGVIANRQNPERATAWELELATGEHEPVPGQRGMSRATTESFVLGTVRNQASQAPTNGEAPF